MAASLSAALACADDGSPADPDESERGTETNEAATDSETGEPPPADLPDTPTPNPDYPHLFVRAEHKPIVLERIEREPYASVLAALHARVDKAPAQRPDAEVWHLDTELHNAQIVRGAAFFAWLFDDPDYAEIARARLDAFQADLDTGPLTDSNIRLLHITYAYADAIDLLLGAGYLDEAEAEPYIEEFIALCEQIHEVFVVQDIARLLYLTPSQNNHPIRTALAMAYIANAYPERTEGAAWRDWSLSELDYLLGPKGHYMSEGGAVSEGPDYHQFGFSASYVFFLAMAVSGNEGLSATRDCINRNDADPWGDHGCVQGEAFTFTSAFEHPPYLRGLDWQLALRMPSGHWPPYEDGRLRYFPGAALETGRSGEGGEYLWAWLDADELSMTRGLETIAHHLVHVDDSVPAHEPAFESRFFDAGGVAVLRSGWDRDARWLLFLAEHGDVRKTLHDHVDSLSFQVAAYGEYLLIDPGYYKPSPLDNARTADSWAHNLVLIDGRTAPDKGLLEDFGDADAFMGATHDGEALDYAEGSQSYQDTLVERAVVMVDERYFVVADALSTSAVAAREHRFRVSGWAGYDAGGSFELASTGARWERSLAGVELYLASTAPGLSLEEPAFVEGEAPHVHEITSGHGHHAVLDGVIDALAPGFLAVVAPYRVAAAPGELEAPLSVAALDLGPGVAAWRVAGPDFVDLVMSREADVPGPFLLPDDRLLSTDARLVVWRMEGEAFVLLSRGSVLEVDAVTVVDGGDIDGITVVEG
nr:heparinase II/III family protein [Pseudenhygromyxa sp. WMMC2535]